VAATAVLGLGAAATGAGWVLATHVLPGPWHAHHTAQVAADRVLPGLVAVDSVWWNPDRGGYVVHARLRDDPDADVVWRMTSSSGCSADPTCETTVRQAVDSARGTAEETRTVLDAFASGGCPVVGLTDLARRDDDLAATVVVAVPRTEVPGVGPRLDACVRAWARGRAGRDGAPSVGADVRLVDPPVDPGDPGRPLVARLAAVRTGPAHSSALVSSDAAGRTISSATASLRPERGLDGGADVARAVDGPVAQWLAAQGDTRPAPHVNDAYTRYVPGRCDRVRMYAPWAYAGSDGVPRSDRAVAVTVDLDGGHPADLAIVPMVDGLPADPRTG
jgi:hypothetical protein